MADPATSVWSSSLSETVSLSLALAGWVLAAAAGAAPPGVMSTGVMWTMVASLLLSSLELSDDSGWTDAVALPGGCGVEI